MGGTGDEPTDPPHPHHSETLAPQDLDRGAGTGFDHTRRGTPPGGPALHRPPKDRALPGEPGTGQPGRRRPCSEAAGTANHSSPKTSRPQKTSRGKARTGTACLRQATPRTRKPMTRKPMTGKPIPWMMEHPGPIPILAMGRLWSRARGHRTGPMRQ